MDNHKQSPAEQARGRIRAFLAPNGDTFGIHDAPVGDALVFDISRNYRGRPEGVPYERVGVRLVIEQVLACRNDDELRELIEIEIAIHNVTS